MGRASQRKKQRRQENKVLITSESTLKQAVEALDEVRAEAEEETIDSQESSTQLPELSEKRTDFSPCFTCDSTEAIAVPSATIHWAEWRCYECDRHRGWIENPANTARRESENQLIDQLLQVSKLGAWERMFLRSVRNTQKRSPRQIQKLNEIALKVGGDV